MPTLSPPIDSAELEALRAALSPEYEVERELGRGGMGAVYLAREQRLDRWVAIKVLPSYLARDPELRERFLREARTAAQLSHPNIVPIHRAEEMAGRAFFVMPWVDGESLGDRLRREGPLDVATAVRLLREVASALAHAHGRGVIHRDVKPENILLEREGGRALVTDFGIARVALASPLTSTGQVLGTVHYMSPEQVSGEPVDGRSDLYSLGIVGYLALAGRLPFDDAAATAVLVAHVTRAARPLSSVAPEVPGELARAIDRCLAKDPGARHANADALVAALDEAWDVARRAGVTPRPDRPAPRILGEDDARSLWRRAAELQAAAAKARERSAEGATAVEPAAGPRMVEPTPGEGYRLEDVRAAAVEAGISERYVALAIDEMAQGAAVRGAAPAERPSARERAAGAPTALMFEAIVDGEVPDAEHEYLVEMIRQAIGEVGIASTIGRSLTWTTSTGIKWDPSSGMPLRQLRVSVVPRNGRTTIRVEEQLGNLAGGVYGGYIGAGGGVGMALFTLAMNTVGALPAVGAGLAALAGSFALARGIYVSSVGRRRTVLERLTRDLAGAVREAVRGRGLAVPPRPPRLRDRADGAGPAP